jgi:hypothetical protein|nr:hypothetical protein [Kofleriaceae bacterium]
MIRTLAVVTALVVAAAGCGDNLASNTQQGSGCQLDSDCAPSTACDTVACTNHACVTTPLASGTAVATQVAGDCKQRQCDGDGNIVDVADDTDVPAPVDCLVQSCSNGSAQHSPQPIGTGCGVGGALMCDGGGDCVNCTLPNQCSGSDTDCQVRTCLQGVCGVDNQPQNTVAAHQVAGDCQKKICDGSGDIDSITDNTDVPNDHNACTSDVCTMGVPSNPDLGSGTTCGTNLQCDGSGDCVTCLEASQCPGSDTECAVRTCNAGTCGVAFTGSGTLVAEQTAGDCNDAVCDGAGNITNTPDDGDVPDDHNDCTTDTCAAGVPHHGDEPQGSACTGGLECDGSGNCGFCGDGVAVNPEQCDGSDLGGNTCATVAGFTAGTLGCDTATCRFDTSSCTDCGNGVVEAGEQCDGSDFGGSTCQSEGFESGTLSCTTPGCQIDTSTCGACGNGVIDGDEVCDPGNGTDIPPAFGGATCTSLGHPSGTLGCSADCNSFDATACTGGFVPVNTGFSTVIGGVATTPTLCDAAFTQNNNAIGVCTRDQGVWAIAKDGTGSWINIANAATTTNGTLGAMNIQGHVVYAGLDNLNGQAVYFSDANANGTNLWKTQPFSTATTAWNNNQSGSDSQQGTSVQIYALHVTNSTLNLLGGWHPALGALLQYGNTKAPQGNVSIGAGITGTVTSLATGETAIPSGDVYVTVYGHNPGTGEPASDLENGPDGTGGGVYYACDLDISSQYSAAGNGHFLPRNGTGDDVTDPTGQTHILTSDQPLVFSIVNTDFSFNGTSGAPQLTCAATGRSYFFSTTWYVALRGGGQVYSTGDDGVTWTKNNSGLPVGAEVFQIAANCNSSGGVTGTTCSANNLLYAATSKGLYSAPVVTGQPLQWTLAGLEGETVRSVMLQNHTTTTPPTIYVGVDDATSLYMHP